MKKVILIIAAALLLVPAARPLFPENADKPRAAAVTEKLRGNERQVLQAIGEGISGAERGPEILCLNTDVTADFPQRKLVALSLIGFKYPSFQPLAESDGEQMLEAAAVSAQISLPPQNDPSEEFLARQAVFANHSLPASVDSRYLSLPFDYQSPVSADITSVFGYRVHPIYGDVRFHYGTDFNVVDGDNIYAFASGTVSTAGNIGGYGLTLIIDHGDGYSSLYGHCSKLLCGVGDSVEAGELVALSGHSGLVTGPHMHFELRHDEQYLNPEYYL